ncbi:phosphate signaling complex protein PhoU [Acidisphaera sp. L21]|jgi:phosphate transport system protein|uniref:phosphate signaling complex protein PhoU n=1 Tax=Acidisphaera sp. L21 TaxID=1641851 RepID=UPI00131B005C|nr:phosphate signaling complex protein PhoU [Acidisphaera sp. L21]
MADLQPEHIVRSYAQELAALRDRMTQMGGLVEAQVAAAAAAVVQQDSDAATRAVEQDPAVDALEREVEGQVIRMLALRQPMAQDLRQIVASLKITAGLERIGDYAANVAKRSIVLAQFSLPFSLSGIAHMLRLVQENLKLVVDAIGENDVEKATQVWRSDQAVDDIYNAIFRELVTYMMEDPRNITPCTHLLFIAKNLERIGDHATNIAETVYYAVTGDSLPEARPKGDSSAYAVVRARG